MASANKNSKPAAEPVAITEVPAEDIAEAIAALTPKLEELSGGTVRETNIEYEDRTFNPTADAEQEYESTEEAIGDRGTVLTTYGEPVGGFPKADK